MPPIRDFTFRVLPEILTNYHYITVDYLPYEARMSEGRIIVDYLPYEARMSEGRIIVDYLPYEARMSEGRIIVDYLPYEARMSEGQASLRHPSFVREVINYDVMVISQYLRVGGVKLHGPTSVSHASCMR